MSDHESRGTIRGTRLDTPVGATPSACDLREVQRLEEALGEELAKLEILQEGLITLEGVGGALGLQHRSQQVAMRSYLTLLQLKSLTSGRVSELRQRLALTRRTMTEQRLRSDKERVEKRACAEVLRDLYQRERNQLDVTDPILQNEPRSPLAGTPEKQARHDR